MARYRLLRQEELTHFEKEFIDYLVVNGIAADDWVKLKEEDSEKAKKIVDLFSDVVFEKILREIKFLDIYSPSYIQSIQCLEDKMVMVALSTADPEMDLLTLDLNHLKSESLTLHKGEKAYDGMREYDLFLLTERGYQIADGSLFKTLILATVQD